MVAIKVQALTVVITASSSGYMVQANFHSQAACRTSAHVASTGALYAYCIAYEHVLLTHSAGTTASA
jgi:hypothetical protein